MADDVVGRLNNVKCLQKIYSCQKKKCMFSLLILCLVSCIIIYVKFSSQMDIHYIMTSSRLGNIYNGSYFDSQQDTISCISLYNLLTKNSSKGCFTLLLKENTSAAVTFLKKYIVKRQTDTYNGDTTNNKNSSGQNNDEKPVGQINDEKPVGQTNDENPVGQIKDQNPVGQMKDEKPVGQINDKPVEQITDEKSIGQLNEEKPTGQINDEKPVRQIKYGKPVEQIHDKKPVGQINDEKPVGQINDEKPVEQTNDEKPVALSNYTNPEEQSNDKKLVKLMKPCNHYVILGGTMGRIGNQMFEVAAVIGMAIKHDMIPIIPENIELSKYFNLPNQVDKVCSDMINARKCICNKASVYYNCADEFHSGENVSMHGYLQSWKYFVHAEFVIRGIFKAKDAYLTKAKEYIESIYLKGYQLVCLHIRRGDMTAPALYEFGYVLPNTSFIEKAKRYFINKYDKVQFLAVSADKRWCREHLEGMHISPFADPGVELALLTSCHHVIVTGGSYGWWGAWLAGGIVVYFNGHQRPNSTLESETNKADYYPPSWIGMSQNP